MYGHDPYDYDARTELIRRAERASINMDEVRELRFVALNINKNGFFNITIPKKVQAPPILN